MPGQDVFEPGRDVSRVRVHAVQEATSAFCKLLTDNVKQETLLAVHPVLGQCGGLCNDSIRSRIDYGLISERAIRIDEQRVEVRSEQLARAFHQHLPHGRTYPILQILVHVSQIGIHLHRHHLFGQFRQIRGDGFQIEEHRGTHEMIREDGRAHSGLLLRQGRAFASLGTDVVITGIVNCYTLQNPIPADEVHLLSVLDPFGQHGLGIEPIVEIKHVACITAQEGSRQRNGLLASRRQGPERVSLSCGSSLQLMNLIADEEIKVPVEALLDVIRHRKPTKPGVVGRPQR